MAKEIKRTVGDTRMIKVEDNSAKTKRFNAQSTSSLDTRKATFRLRRCRINEKRDKL